MTLKNKRACADVKLVLTFPNWYIINALQSMYMHLRLSRVLSYHIMINNLDLYSLAYMTSFQFKLKSKGTITNSRPTKLLSWAGDMLCYVSYKRGNDTMSMYGSRVFSNNISLYINYTLDNRGRGFYHFYSVYTAEWSKLIFQHTSNSYQYCMTFTHIVWHSPTLYDIYQHGMTFTYIVWHLCTLYDIYLYCMAL